MQTYRPQQAKEWILRRLERKPFRSFSEEKLSRLIEDFVRYDQHFMRVAGVLDENDRPGEEDYDEDEAFEFIYDAYLSDHPDDQDEDMLTATLLDRYMDLQADFWAESGLADE